MGQESSERAEWLIETHADLHGCRGTLVRAHAAEAVAEIARFGAALGRIERLHRSRSQSRSRGKGETGERNGKIRSMSSVSCNIQNTLSSHATQNNKLRERRKSKSIESLQLKITYVLMFIIISQPSRRMSERPETPEPRRTASAQPHTGKSQQLDERERSRAEKCEKNEHEERIRRRVCAAIGRSERRMCSVCKIFT